MNLDPAIMAHLEAMDLTVTLDPHDIPARREFLRHEIDRIFTLFGTPGPPVEAIRDHTVAVDGGEILLRTYHPASSSVLPGHVLAHGGGWTTGSVDELVCDAAARHRAVRANCVVALIEYRLAPEYRFPTAVYDVIAAVRWVRDHATELGVDAQVMTLGGASAGANLSAAAVVGDPDLDLAALVLEVPVLDLTGASARAAGAESRLEGLPATIFEQAVEVVGQASLEYLGDARLGVSPLASPLLAADLAGFPETFVLTAELDPLHPEGARFVERLQASGVAAHLTHYAGAMHGSPILTATWPTARRWQDDIVAILNGVHRRALETTDVPRRAG